MPRWFPCRAWNCLNNKTRPRRQIFWATRRRIALKRQCVKAGIVFAPTDVFIGMDGFGASAPADQLFQHFGITAEAIIDAARNGL